MTDEPKTADQLEPTRRQALESLFSSLPKAYDERVTILQTIRDSFYRELARHMQPALNDYVKTLPQNTLEERRALATLINETLRHFGLALISPDTNEPAILIADFGGRSEVMRFRFQTREHSGKRVRSSSSFDLPDLELMPAPTRVEILSREFRNRRDDMQNR